jgi:hypothetical protein
MVRSNFFSFVRGFRRRSKSVLNPTGVQTKTVLIVEQFRNSLTEPSSEGAKRDFEFESLHLRHVGQSLHIFSGAKHAAGNWK